jgi:hypothetical protein
MLSLSIPFDSATRQMVAGWPGLPPPVPHRTGRGWLASAVDAKREAG